MHTKPSGATKRDEKLCEGEKTTTPRTETWLDAISNGVPSAVYCHLPVPGIHAMYSLPARQAFQTQLTTRDLRCRVYALSA